MADQLNVEIEEVGHVRKVSVTFTPTTEVAVEVVDDEARRY
jgi:hypothetical protein